jgi:hypothetical protein
MKNIRYSNKINPQVVDDQNQNTKIQGDKMNRNILGTTNSNDHAPPMSSSQPKKQKSAKVFSPDAGYNEKIASIDTTDESKMSSW